MKSTTVAALVIALPAAAACSAYVIAMAAPKDARISNDADSVEAKKTFWSLFHGQRYVELPLLIDQIAAAYVAHPNDPELALLAGHAHFWAVSERRRLDPVPAPVSEHLVLAEHYFLEAQVLAPYDSRIKSWIGAARVALAEVRADERLRRTGYFDLLHAKGAWPEFNNFGFGYVLTLAPRQSEEFGNAVKAFWYHVRACLDQPVDPAAPDLSALQATQFENEDRVCYNNWYAPHNVEGFLLAMGDALLKAGRAEQASAIMRNATSLASYAEWPFRDQLQARLASAQDRAARFTDDDPQNDPELMIESAYSCTGCHAAEPSTIARYEPLPHALRSAGRRRAARR